MRLILWLGYAFLLVLLYQCAENRRRAGTEAHLVAATPLKANRLLREGDLRPVYLRRDRAEGQRITEADLAPWPALELPSGALPVALPLRRSRSQPPVDSGDRAMLCPSPRPPAPSMPVIAVLCDRRGASCLAIAAATPAQAAEIAQAPPPPGGRWFAQSCR